MGALFKNRTDAGKKLAELARGWTPPHPLVLALPRGGVPVAAQLAEKCGFPLDIFLVKRLGTPNHPEFAMGALATGGTMVWNPDVLSRYQLTDKVTLPILEQARAQLRSQIQIYRQWCSPVAVADQDVLIVDDSSVSGATLKAAALALRDQNVKSLSAAVPVATRAAREKLLPLVQHLFCLREVASLEDIPSSYADFTPTEESEIKKILTRVTPTSP